MNELFFEQDSKQWHEARKKRIGASDVPIILGLSPYKTATELWEEKIGERESKPGNYVMERGKRLEAIARDLIKNQYGVFFQPRVLVDKKQSFLMASLDGFAIHDGSTFVWENKAPGRDEHARTSDGPPEKYYPQIQTQLLVSEADACVYSTIVEAEGEYNINSCIVLPDKAMFEVIREEVEIFWECMQTKTPPKLRENDFEVMLEPAAIKEALRYERLIIEKKKLEAEIESVKENLIKGMTHNKAVCKNLKITKSNGRETIDYKSIPELKSVDLKKYTKTGKPYYTVSVIS